MGTIIGAALFVILFNLIALSVFLQLPPAWGLAWVVLLGAGFLWWHVRPHEERDKRARLVRLAAPTAAPRWVLVAIAASLSVAFGIAAVLQPVAPTLHPDDVSSFHQALLAYQQSWVGWLALIGMTAGVVPLVEEFCFRGYIQHTVERKLGPVIGIAFASAGFTLLHVGAPHWSILLIPLALGIATGLAASVFQSIWAAVAIHSLWNFSMSAWAKLENAPILSADPKPSLLLAFGISLIAGGILGWVMVVRRNAIGGRPAAV